MPWEAILGGATGGAAAAIVLAVLFAKSLVEKIALAAEQRFERAEENRGAASGLARFGNHHRLRSA